MLPAYFTAIKPVKPKTPRTTKNCVSYLKVFQDCLIVLLLIFDLFYLSLN